MEEIEILKIIAAFISAFGTIAVYKYNVAQSEKARADLIEKFEQALSQDKKHATCELFRMLHGLRMDYEDIQAISSSSKVVKIICALQKTPGMVKHVNGCIQYTPRFEKRWVRVAIKVGTRWLAYGLFFLVLLVISFAIYLKGAASLAMLLFAVPITVLWAMQVKEIHHDLMVESLVDGAEK